MIRLSMIYSIYSTSCHFHHRYRRLTCVLWYLVGLSNSILYYEGSSCDDLVAVQAFSIGVCTATEDTATVKVLEVVSGDRISLDSYISGDALYVVGAFEDGIALAFTMSPTGSELGCHMSEGSSAYITLECRQGRSHFYYDFNSFHVIVILQ